MTALKCPICGKPLPPPVRKGGRPRKFCCRKCAAKAGHEYRKARGYRRPKTHRHLCALCGDVFMTGDASQRFCSVTCSMRARSKDAEWLLKEMAEDRERKLRQLESCRETAPITVEERGGVRIETRGQRCIGWRSAGCVKHV